jgi:excisionase family DNA binding protein
MTTRLAYPVSEAARLLGVSARSVRYLLKSGKLGFAKIGRRIVIPHAALDQLLRRASVGPTGMLVADASIRQG